MDSFTFIIMRVFLPLLVLTLLLLLVLRLRNVNAGDCFGAR